MNKIILIIFLIASPFLKAQSFEGTLTYLCEGLINNNKTEISELKSLTNGGWSDTIRITFKKGDYFEVGNNKTHSKRLYRADSNKIYAWGQPKDTNICTIYETNLDLIKKTKKQEEKFGILDTLVVVKGVLCKVIRITSNSLTYEYYFNDSLYKMQSNYYSKHCWQGWYTFLKHTNALPIMIVVKTKTKSNSITACMTLVEAKEEFVNEQLFNVPELLPSEIKSFITNQKVMLLKSP